MLPPVLLIKIKTSICPCLASDQDNAAMNAMTSVNGLSIDYYHSNKDDGKGGAAGAAVAGVGKLVSGLFGKVAGAGGAGAGSAFSTQAATLSVVDSVRGPALCIECETEQGDGGSNKSGAPPGPSPGETKSTKSKHTFPFKKMGNISASSDSILSSSLSSSTGICIRRKKKNKHDTDKTLCQFDLRALSGDERDDIMEQLRILIQWDADRRLNNPNAEQEENDDDDEDDEDNNRGLGSRALKMKHFAEREIELSKQKRDREARKARYLKDAGGLKYTAVAMANREMS